MLAISPPPPNRTASFDALSTGCPPAGLLYTPTRTTMPADVPMEGPLLKGVRAPPFKVACATAWGLWIIGTFGLFMHILHEHHEVRSRPGGAQHEVVLITLAFPLSAMLLMILIIPLFGERALLQPWPRRQPNPHDF